MAKKRSAKKGEPSLEQLKKLYGLMGKIKALEPWEKLWDMDLVCIQYDAEDLVVCSIMGRNKECFGIGVYPGPDSIAALFRMADTGAENPFHSLGYMNCISCYFGDRDDLYPEERQRIKEMGLAFRGKNNWPYFRRSRPECLPWHINAADAGLLETVLQEFITAYSQFVDKKIAVNFEKDEVLLHQFSKEKKSWITRASPMPLIPVYADCFMFTNEILAASLKSKTVNNCSLEADVIYFPMSPGSDKDGFPAAMRLAVLVEAKKGIIAAQRFLEPDDNSADEIIDLLCDFINEHGKPKMLCVRDEWAEHLFEDFCKKIDLPINSEDGVPLVDEAAEELMNNVMRLAT